MIEEYNSGAYNVERFFEKLIEFARELDEEEKCDLVYQHVYDSNYGVGQNVYAQTA